MKRVSTPTSKRKAKPLKARYGKVWMPLSFMKVAKAHGMNPDYFASIALEAFAAEDHTSGFIIIDDCPMPDEAFDLG